MYETFTSESITRRRPLVRSKGRVIATDSEINRNKIEGIDVRSWKL